MKKITYIVFTFLAGLAACNKKAGPALPQVLNTGSNEAVAPYFTRDSKQNPVLCWTEKDRADSTYRLKYAVYNAGTRQFDSPITVPASAGCSNAAESMAKVAFKADGTVLAIFARRFPNEKNPYAGAIYYSISADHGLNWSDARFLHTDTAHTYGRSFFDVARLKDGELGAIWLDGRYGKNIRGSALFFARTTAGKGFATDTCIAKGTCECCRTAIFSDDSGNIHLAYRNINFPSALSAKQVRDMAYQLSSDHGKTFSVPSTISHDNWEITGCPHSGPSVAVTKAGVQAVWFTAGGGAGLYHTASAGLGGDFRQRNLITASGRHPQLISLKNDQLLMVCEEAVSAAMEKPMEMNHSHSEMKMSHTAAGTAKIMLTRLPAGPNQKNIEVTDGTAADNHAVLTSVGDDVLIAWVREEKSGSKIYYSRIALTE
ncbi:sialidase family protein [Pedobacter heparinus]|uniref:sialidase family protein n=1 Tax=Pedobacter heparinus TaxID=984 RepID=UPI00292DB971|nr:sialidase family protein [Pedobacter heparinus]